MFNNTNSITGSQIPSSTLFRHDQYNDCSAEQSALRQSLYNMQYWTNVAYVQALHSATCSARNSASMQSYHNFHQFAIDVAQQGNKNSPDFHQMSNLAGNPGESLPLSELSNNAYVSHIRHLGKKWGIKPHNQFRSIQQAKSQLGSESFSHPNEAVMQANNDFTIQRTTITKQANEILDEDQNNHKAEEYDDEKDEEFENERDEESETHVEIEEDYDEEKDDEEDKDIDIENIEQEMESDVSDEDKVNLEERNVIRGKQEFVDIDEGNEIVIALSNHHGTYNRQEINPGSAAILEHNNVQQQNFEADMWWNYQHQQPHHLCNENQQNVSTSNPEPTVTVVVKKMETYSVEFLCN